MLYEKVPEKKKEEEKRGTIGDLLNFIVLFALLSKGTSSTLRP